MSLVIEDSRKAGGWLWYNSFILILPLVMMNDISDILESKQKSATLAFLLLAEERAFSVTELSKRLRIPDRVMQSVMREFEKISLVNAFSRDRHLFYIVNQRHKLLPEIKQSLLKNQKSFDDELFTSIKKLGEIKGAFLSGVFTGQPQLPVDLLLVGKVNLGKLEKFLQNCKKIMGVDINYSIMTVDEFIMRRDTFDRFLKDIFDYHHVVVHDLTNGRPKKGKK